MELFRIFGGALAATPSTGDKFAPFLFVLLLLGAGCLLVAIAIDRTGRKKKNNDKK